MHRRPRPEPSDLPRFTSALPYVVHTAAPTSITTPRLVGLTAEQEARDARDQQAIADAVDGIIP